MRSAKWFHVLCLLLLAGMPAMSSSQVLEQDSLVLVDLYNYLDGPNWNGKWDLNTPVSTWYRLTLENGRVTSLNLGANNLSGNLIPSSLANLDSLTYLDLASNPKLTAPVPDALYQLDALVQIDFSLNGMTGSFSSQIANLKNLIVFKVNESNFSGPVPAELSQLKNIQYIYLGGNNFDEPVLETLVQLPALKTLNLWGAVLHEEIPPEIGNLHDLETLILSNNQFYGTVPQELTTITGIKQLDLSYNDLDSLPDFAPLVNLTRLYIDNNNLSFDDIEPQMQLNIDNYRYSPQDSCGDGGSLTTWTGEKLELTAPDASALNQYQWIKDGLDLPGENSRTFLEYASGYSDAGRYSCRITNPGVPDLTIYMKSVMVYVRDYGFLQDSLALVDLYNSTGGANWLRKEGWLSKPLSEGWQGVQMSGSRVTHILLSANNLDGTIPHTIGNMDSLMIFQAGNNQLTGSLPEEFGNLKKLKVLDLRVNQMSGALPFAIGYAKALTEIYLFDNQFSGQLPVELWQLTNMEILNLSGNDFEGELPAAIGNLTKLRYFSVYDNQMTGAIPDEVYSLTNLTDLVLSYNKFSAAPISPLIGNLVNLKSLYMAEINAMGSIPDEIGSLTELDILHLFGNQLTGAVPASFNNLHKMYALYLHKNKLDALPVLDSLPSYTSLHVYKNQLMFDDLEPFMGLGFSNFEYSPQDSVGEKMDSVLTPGQFMYLAAHVDGSSNAYQWLLNGAEIPGAQYFEYVINEASAADTGVYICRITSVLVPDLKLYTRPSHLQMKVPQDLSAYEPGSPLRFDLAQNYPNPFNQQTVIRYQLASAGKVSIELFNLQGQYVCEILHAEQNAGSYTINTDMGNLASGVYYYKFQAGEFTAIRRMILLR